MRRFSEFMSEQNEAKVKAEQDRKATIELKRKLWKKFVDGVDSNIPVLPTEKVTSFYKPEEVRAQLHYELLNGEGPDGEVVWTLEAELACDNCGTKLVSRYHFGQVVSSRIYACIGCGWRDSILENKSSRNIRISDG